MAIGLARGCWSSLQPTLHTDEIEWIQSIFILLRKYMITDTANRAKQTKKR
jgi:hypothetical protein